MIFGTAPPNPTPTWHPEPQARGTFSILFSCLITLGLCIWTAVHLNIPEHKSCLPKRYRWDPRVWLSRQQWRKLGWLMTGLLAPEMIAFTAWSQWSNAHLLTKKMQRAFHQEADHSHRTFAQTASHSDLELRHLDRDVESGHPGNTISNVKRRHLWTVEHSFFALMGGIAFDISDLPPHQRFLPGGRTRLTIMPSTLLILAEVNPALIPDISAETIRDKGKADSLAKGIICLQAMWFLIQCLSRLCKGLPLSLLELNTSAHTLCALLSFSLWWKKPSDVKEPAVICGPQALPLLALLCFQSDVGDKWQPEKLWFIKYIKMLSRSDQEPSPVLGLNHYSPPEDCDSVLRTTLALAGQTKDQEHGVMKLYQGQSVAGICYVRSRKRMWVDLSPPVTGVLHFWRPWIRFTAQDQYRWALAVKGSQQYPELCTTENFEGVPVLEPLLRDPASDRIRDWPISETGLTPKRERTFQRDTWFAIVLAGLIYGAIHLLAWSAPVPTPVETTLWRYSATTVAASGLVIVPFIALVKAVGQRLQQFKARWDVLAMLFCILTGAIALAYLLARVFLVVESFRSLAYLPSGAYEVPQWDYFFPHII